MVRIAVAHPMRSPMRRLRDCRFQIASLLLSVHVGACTSHKVVASAPPTQLLESVKPPAVHVTRADGARIRLSGPIVRNDSLEGLVPGKDAGRRMTLALSDVTTLSFDQPFSAAWRVGMPSPAAYVETEHPKSVQVTRGDLTKLKLESPVVRGDSLVGQVTEPGSPAPPTVAFADVRVLAAPRPSPGKTLGLIAAVGVVAVVATFIGACARNDCGD